MSFRKHRSRNATPLSLPSFPRAGGLCIDVGKEVWSSIANQEIKDPKGEAIKFAKEAEKLLAQYKNVLPEKHLCSDTRHKIPLVGTPKDAHFGKIAVLLF